MALGSLLMQFLYTRFVAAVNICGREIYREIMSQFLRAHIENGGHLFDNIGNVF